MFMATDSYLADSIRNAHLDIVFESSQTGKKVRRTRIALEVAIRTVHDAVEYLAAQWPL